MSKLQRSSRRGRGSTCAAVIIAVGLIAASCGGDDEPTTAPAPTDATAPGDDTTPEETDGGATTDTEGGSDETAAPATNAPPPTAAPEEVPVPGGKVVMGIEADSSSPWRPSEMVCAISCHQVIKNIYDSLAMPSAENGWTPYLAESITPNDDFTEWRITARGGVTFHDGTPFDGAAIVDNLTRAKTGILTGNILRAVDTIEIDAADPMTAVVTTSTPWASLPFSFFSAVGYMASPTWLAASDADENLKDEPVGTGPFVYEDYKPNEVFSMTKNAEYWNQPYPYLDAIEFRPIPDALNRRDALKSGTIDLFHSTNGETIAEFRESAEFPMTEITNNAETAHTLLHVTQEGSPITDARVRCALAYATDNQALIDTIGAGVNQLASGPFSPTQVGYLEETGFPLAQDMAKAQDLIAQYKAENPGPLQISLATTQDQTNLTIAQFQQQWWTEAGVDEVTIDQIDQGNYIVTALLGNFQVFQWRNHGGFDLDMQYHWWHSSSSVPVGELALNFGRIKDSTLDALLEENRGTDDAARKKEIAEEVNKLFGTQCYNLWGSYTIWAIAHKPAVHGVTTFELPDGSNAQFGAGIAGTFYPMTLWAE